MKTYYLALIYLICCNSSWAFDLQSLNPKIYPEEQNKLVNIDKTKSALELHPHKNFKIPQYYKDLESVFSNNIAQGISALTLNKFSLGTGVVNVTYQVKEGVKQALKETFAGYAEYERRKAAEESINANLKTQLMTKDLLIGLKLSNQKNNDPKIKEGFVDFFGNYYGLSIFETIFKNNQNKSMFRVIKAVVKTNIIQEIIKIIKYFAFSLLLLFIGLLILNNIKNNTSLSYGLNQGLFKAIYLLPAIALGDQILLSIVDLFVFLQKQIKLVFFNNYDIIDQVSKTHISWEKLANNAGYLPVQILSWLDQLGQFLTIFFVAALVVYLILGFLLYPLWLLASVFKSLQAGLSSSFLLWLKSGLIICFLPVLFLVIDLVSQEFNSANQHLFGIILSMLGFYFIPSISGLIIAKK